MISKNSRGRLALKRLNPAEVQAITVYLSEAEEAAGRTLARIKASLKDGIAEDWTRTQVAYWTHYRATCRHLLKNLLDCIKRKPRAESEAD